MRVTIGEIPSGQLGPIGLAFEHPMRSEWRLVQALRFAYDWATDDWREAKTGLFAARMNLNLQAYFDAEERVERASTRRDQYAGIVNQVSRNSGVSFVGDEARIAYEAVMWGIHLLPKGRADMGEPHVTTDFLLGLIKRDWQA